MPTLAQTVETLTNHPDVAGAVVVSEEGLVVASSVAAPLEAETIAALAATAQRALGPLGDALGQGKPRQVVVESESGCSIMTRLGSGATLLVLAREEGDLGALLHRLRAEAPLLRELT